jgi:hypothetical protein
VILRALPGPVANRVREELNLAPTKLTREVRPDILAVIRWTFERQLERTLPKRAEFSMADLLTFDGREVLTLCDSLGAKALATAIAGLPAEERARFLDSLPPDQRELCARASSATSTHRLEADDARGVIARTTQGTTPSDALRLVGARRLARACVTHSPEFAAALIERQRGDFGRHLARFVSEERKQGARRGDQLLAEEVLAELERLSERGVIERPLRVGVPVMRPHPATATLPPRADGKTPVVKAPLPRRETVIAPGSGGDRPQRVEMPVLRVPPKPKPRGPSRGGR